MVAFTHQTGLHKIARLVASPTADPVVANSIQARSYTFVEIDHEIISSHSPPAYSRRVVVSYKRKYVHEVQMYWLTG